MVRSTYMVLSSNVAHSNGLLLSCSLILSLHLVLSIFVNHSVQMLLSFTMARLLPLVLSFGMACHRDYQNISWLDVPTGQFVLRLNLIDKFIEWFYLLV